MLCEKELKKRFKILLNKNLINEKTLGLISIGRHFFIENFWIVIGRDEKENALIENMQIGELIGPFKNKPSARIISKLKSEKIKNTVDELINSYSKNSSLEQRKKFEEYKR